ncbi:MAG: class I SAM-dependent methyltransferase [Pseudonocardiaceae bacterium]
MAGNQPAQYQVPTGVGLTAVGVAAVRAGEGRHGDPLFDDPFAADFVTAVGGTLSFFDGRRPPAARDDGDLWSWFLTYLPIRTRFFDDYFRQACAEGCRQAVILAAGLDTRAFRLAWPSGVRLFELDTPEVLVFKDQVLARRAATPACRRVIINADLRQDWPAAAVRAGFHPGEPTAWLAEGLLLYLTPDECDQLFERIGQLSAPGSRLAVEYLSGDLRQGMVDTLNESPDDALLKTIWQSGEQEHPARWLSRNGWRVHDYGVSERAQSYGRPLPDFTGPVAQAALVAGGGLIIARRP